MKLTLTTIAVLAFLCCSAQEPDGMLAKYSFNFGNHEEDVTGTPVKIVGATYTDDRFGNSNCAMYLHGNYESYLNLGTHRRLKPTVGSISMWITMDNIVYSGKGYASNPIILTKSHAGNDFFESYSIAIQVNTQKLAFTSSLSEEYQVTLHSVKPISFARWYHVAVTYDEKQMSLYLDGELQSRMSRSFNTVFLEGDSVMIGNSANTKNKRFFNGAVDDIEFYDRVLSKADVEALYKAPDPNRLNIIFKWISAFVLSMMGIALIVLLFTKRYKKELAREKEKNKLQRQMYEMEMQVMKAQMNPHFIFNAMNSVQQFILAGDNENAHKYLGKFSKLLRKILESGKDEFITLENEIDMLTKYIEIEALRFGPELKFEIVTDVMNSKVRIPQMLIQPIVENSIWHGLLPKKGDRSLFIKFEALGKKFLSCTVDDNGVGRNGVKPQELMKEKSLAINFISHRLELMQKEWGDEISISIVDKTDDHGSNAGTRVKVVMPIIS